MNALVPQTEAPRPNLVAGGRPMAIVPQTMDEAYRLGKAISISGMAPRGMDTPEKCMIAIMRGMEVGLSPMQAVDKIAIVNGRPTIWGDGAIGLVRGSGLCEFVQEKLEGDGDKKIATCSAKRKGEPEPTVRSFSVDQAKKAGLWGKSGPWQQFPDRMLQMRARAFALRDLFADVLGGLYLREEIEDDRPARSDSPPPAPRREVARRPEPAVIEHQHSETTAQAAPAAPVKDAEDRGGSSPSESSASDHDENGVVSMESLLTELDERLGFAKTAEDVEEAYTDFDAEPIFSDYEGGVQAARKLKAKHLDRVPASKADKPAQTADDDFPGNEALAKAQAKQQESFVVKDPFAIPTKFKGGGHYQIFIRAAAQAAKPGDVERLTNCWNATKEQRAEFLGNGQLHAVDSKSLREELSAALDRIAQNDDADGGDTLPPPAPSAQRAQESRQAAGGDEAPPPAPKPASGDAVAAYTARMDAAFAAAANKEDVDKFWFGSVDERDGSGATDDQRSKWKIARSKARNALPEEG